MYADGNRLNFVKIRTDCLSQVELDGDSIPRSVVSRRWVSTVVRAEQVSAIV